MNHKLRIALAALALAAAVLLMLALPQALREKSIARALNGVTVERMDALPAEQTPAPVSDRERTEEALVWLNRADESAEFARRREDVAPAGEELTQSRAWERLTAQWEVLEAWGFSLPGEDVRTARYFRMVHGVTQDYQGYYVLTAGQGADEVACTVSSSTGALLACAWTKPPLPLPALAEAFAQLWGIENGSVLKHFNHSSIDWEYCVYGNGGAHYIYVVSGMSVPGCAVSLRPGTGERT